MSEELAWAAGLFDGEGSASFASRPRIRRSLSMNISQKDRRVLDRFAAAVGVGKVYGPYHGKGAPFAWNIRNPVGFHLAMWLLWPWLDEIKRAQLDRVSEIYRRTPVQGYVRGRIGRKPLTERQKQLRRESSLRYYYRRKEGVR